MPTLAFTETPMATRTMSSREFSGSSQGELTPSMLHLVHPGLLRLVALAVALAVVLALAVWVPSVMGRPSCVTVASPVSPLMVSAVTRLAIGGARDGLAVPVSRAKSPLTVSVAFAALSAGNGDSG